MTTVQENKLAMYRMVEQYLLSQPSVVAALPNYVGSFAAFQACLQHIQQHKQAQEINQGGLAEQKGQRKEHLVTLASDVISKLRAYATFSKQTVLLREVNYSASELRGGAASVLVARTRIIHDKAKENLKVLADYRVSADTLKTLQRAIDAFEASITEPRMGTLARKNATDALQQAYQAADRLVREELDVLVGMVQFSEPVFYGGYQNARLTVSRKGSRANGSKDDTPSQAA